MVIEWQKIRVRPEARDRWLEKDEEIWSAGLAQEEGFEGKQVWAGEEDSELILVVHWRSREHWKGIAQERLDELGRRFSEAVPAEHWERIEIRCYEVLRSS